MTIATANVQGAQHSLSLHPSGNIIDLVSNFHIGLCGSQEYDLGILLPEVATTAVLNN